MNRKIIAGGKQGKPSNLDEFRKLFEVDKGYVRFEKRKVKHLLGVIITEGALDSLLYPPANTRKTETFQQQLDNLNKTKQEGDEKQESRTRMISYILDYLANVNDSDRLIKIYANHDKLFTNKDDNKTKSMHETHILNALRDVCNRTSLNIDHYLPDITNPAPTENMISTLEEKKSLLELIFMIKKDQLKEMVGHKYSPSLWGTPRSSDPGLEAIDKGEKLMKPIVGMAKNLNRNNPTRVYLMNYLMNYLNAKPSGFDDIEIDAIWHRIYSNVMTTTMWKLMMQHNNARGGYPAESNFDTAPDDSGPAT